MSKNELSKAAGSKWDRNVEHGIRSPWVNNKYILGLLQKQISGHPGRFWLNYVFEDLIARKFERAFSIGCGAGNHELILARTGLFKRIDAYDISEVSISRATENAAAENITNIHFFVGDHDEIVRDQSRFGSYDCVCFFGSLHHVRNIEEMLRYAFNLLTDDGLLVFEEYTGPLYTLLSHEQLEVTNRILDCIDDELRADGGKPFSNPTIKMVYKDDPSEGVRSSLILPLLNLYFEMTHLQPMSGVIVQKLYNLLNHDRLNDGSAESRTIIDLLFLIEDLLVEDGRLTHTRHLGVCSPRKELRPLSVFGV